MGGDCNFQIGLEVGDGGRTFGGAEQEGPGDKIGSRGINELTSEGSHHRRPQVVKGGGPSVS